MDLTDYSEYVIIDSYDNYESTYFLVTGYGESFWCRLVSHDPADDILILRVDQLLNLYHPFNYGDLIKIKFTFQL